MSALSRPALALLCAAALAQAGCGLLPEIEEDEHAGKTAAQLYTEGKSAWKVGNYLKSIEIFQYLESSFPFDPYAQQGMLEMAYAHLRRDEHDEAIALLDRFIEQNPVHAHIAYAHYLRGVVHFNYGQSLLHYVFPYIRHNKDPEPWRAAFENFSWIVKNAPDSPYAKDALHRTKFLRNLLAEHEIHVLDFYLRRKAYVAVATRSREALARYHESPAMADILWYQEQAYRQLEMPQLADGSRRVRELNFPDYRSRDARAVEDEPSWLGRAAETFSDLADYVAVNVGFDISDLEPQSLSEHYRIVQLPIPASGEYQPEKKTEKVLVTQLPSGFAPQEHGSQRNIWDRFWALITFRRGSIDEASIPTAPAEPAAAPPPAASAPAASAPAAEGASPAAGESP